MPIEVANYISDLVITNPPGTDLESQGSNHLRLVKAVLQTTFPRTGKSFNFPGASSKNSNYSVSGVDSNTLFLVDTSGGTVTFTLPTLGAGDAGWRCEFLKLGANATPYYVAPPSGTLQSGEVTGLTVSRRCIPGRKTEAFWSGSTWYLTRVPSVPIGTVLDCWLGSLPPGYEWTNGQSLSSVTYPDFNTFTGAGTTPDLTGRCTFGLDNVGGVITNRITVAQGNWDGSTRGQAGGVQALSIAQGNLPNVNLPSTSLSASAAAHSHSVTDIDRFGGQLSIGAGKAGVLTNGVGDGLLFNSTGSASPAVSISGNVPLGGSNTPLPSVSPGMSIPKIIVVE